MDLYLRDNTQAVYLPKSVQIQTIHCHGSLFVNHMMVQLSVTIIGPGLIYTNCSTGAHLYMVEPVAVEYLQLVRPAPSEHPIHLIADKSFQVVQTDVPRIQTFRHSYICYAAQPFGVSQHVYITQYITLDPDTAVRLDEPTLIVVHSLGIVHNQNGPIVPHQWTTVQGLITTNHTHTVPYPRISLEGSGLIFRRQTSTSSTVVSLSIRVPPTQYVHIVRTGLGTFRGFVQQLGLGNVVTSHRWAVVGNARLVHTFFSGVQVIEFQLFSIVLGDRHWFFHPRMHSRQRCVILKHIQSQLVGSSSYILNIPRWLSASLVDDIVETLDVDRIIVSTTCQDTTRIYASTLQRYLGTSDIHSVMWDDIVLQQRLCTLLRIPGDTSQPHLLMKRFQGWLEERIVYTPSDDENDESLVQHPPKESLPQRQYPSGPYHLLVYYAPVETAALPWGQPSLLPDGYEAIETVSHLPDGVYGVVTTPTSQTPLECILHISNQGKVNVCTYGTIPHVDSTRYFIPRISPYPIVKK